MGAQMTLRPKAIRKADEKIAKEIAIGGRCSDPARFRAVHAAILSVVADGQEREVTEWFLASMGGKSPAYNMLHRMFKLEVNRKYWPMVQAVAMVNCTDKKGSVTGTTTTTEEVARLFICPVK